MTAMTAFSGEQQLRHESRGVSRPFSALNVTCRSARTPGGSSWDRIAPYSARRAPFPTRSIEQIAELVADGMLKVHRALEPSLLESTYWLPREWRPPWGSTTA